jgi:hypothetical protein
VIGVIDSVPLINKFNAIASYIDNSEFIKKVYENLDCLEIAYKVMRILNNKQTGSIVYVLSKVIYSTRYELSMLTKINYGNITRHILDAEELGIIKRLDKRNKDYDVFKSFWKSIHPNTSDETEFYYFDSCFQEVAIQAESMLSKYFILTQKYKIGKRGERWLTYKKSIEIQNKKDKLAKKNSLGECYRCSKLIPKTSDESDYYILNSKKKRYLCRLCSEAATFDDKLKWSQQ